MKLESMNTTDYLPLTELTDEDWKKYDVSSQSWLSEIKTILCSFHLLCIFKHQKNITKIQQYFFSLTYLHETSELCIL